VADKAKVGMIGLMGYGNIVRRGLKAAKNLELAGIWSRSPKSIERSQSEYPSKVCESYDALLAEDIEAVIIVNPNWLHLEYSLPVAKAGKAVLMEKPMTNTVAEAKQMVAAFKEAGTLLAVKHLHRYGPIPRKIKQLVEDGELGEILSVEMYTSHDTSKTFLDNPLRGPDYWKRDPKKCPAVPLTQLGVHYIDSVMSFMGEPTWVQSAHRNVLKLSDNVDCTVTTLGYGEVTATCHAHYVVPGYGRLAIYGTKGLAIWEGNTLRVKKEGEKGFEANELTEAPDASLVQCLEDFGDALLKETPFETEGEQSLMVVAAAEAAILSAAEDNRKINLKEYIEKA
jgi:predicted dehydrogenase